MRWYMLFFFFFSSRRRHTRCGRDWSSDVCSSDLLFGALRPQDLGSGAQPEHHTFGCPGLFRGPRVAIGQNQTNALGRVAEQASLELGCLHGSPPLALRELRRDSVALGEAVQSPGRTWRQEGPADLF